MGRRPRPGMKIEDLVNHVLHGDASKSKLANEEEEAVEGPGGSDAKKRDREAKLAAAGEGSECRPTWLCRPMISSLL